MRCKAHSTMSKERCKKWAMRGAYVCRAHGGAAPQTKRVAQRRLDTLAFVALDVLADLMTSRDPYVRLAAAKIVLDAAGLRPSRQHRSIGGNFTEVDAFMEAVRS